MRANGILMPIFSLSSPYGIGTLGKEAYDFVDFLNKAGQSYWQVLPLGPTGYGDSPYQPFSAFAGNPYFIDLRWLMSNGWLEAEDFKDVDFGDNRNKIDYAKLYKNRLPVLRKAYIRFLKNIPADYCDFVKEHSIWLEDYALYTVIKENYAEKGLQEFPKALLERNEQAIEKAAQQHSNDVEFIKVLQYWFFTEWKRLKDYANKNGIKIIGDLPIYVSRDSSDVWADPKAFLLDKDYNPTFVAGCPPDAFSEDGQLWGNPLYNWEYMKSTNYAWWKNRLLHAEKLYDIVRIDHFRGFDEYYSIPADAPTAKKGKWRKGPGEELFIELSKCFTTLGIIAEDLGTITPSVRELLKRTGYPGMAVLQFGFDPEEESRYLPHNIEKNSVVYTGTHDNDTAIGWMEEGDPAATEYCRKYLRLTEAEGYNWGMIKAAMSTAADTCILQMQDFMGLSNTARINTPGKNEGNWQWRIEGSCLNDWLAEIIFKLTKDYCRLGLQNKKSD